MPQCDGQTLWHHVDRVDPPPDPSTVHPHTQTPTQDKLLAGLGEIFEMVYENSWYTYFAPVVRMRMFGCLILWLFIVAFILLGIMYHA